MHGCGWWVRTLSASGLVLCMGTGWSGAAWSLDLVGAYELGRDNDPVFKAESYSKLAIDESLRIAWARLLPNAVGQAGYTRQRQDVKSSDNTVFAIGGTSFPVKTCQALAEITGDEHRDLREPVRDFALAEPQPGDPETWVRAALRSNPSIQAREQAVNAAKREVWRQRSAHAPTLDFRAGIDNRDTDGTLFGGGSQVENAEYAVELRVPLFSGGGGDGGAGAADAGA